MHFPASGRLVEEKPCFHLSVTAQGFGTNFIYSLKLPCDESAINVQEGNRIPQFQVHPGKKWNEAAKAGEIHYLVNSDTGQH